ncbi:hypothetical protein B0H16DRAFT_1451051 [Mycena metata]|uniref:Uncharacterized protein n=1 Tax=Mycena metata TaxID=1033252 RepID=A0AAD7NS39_9AGAR|nr:hypothetical protein B0H16DRAFT_1451051 [Mycena metata]
MNPLTGFKFKGNDNYYVRLHQFLWPSSPPEASAAHEPHALTRCIDVWAGPMDVDGSEPTSERYIDLDKHPQLRVHSLRCHPPAVLVRAEYHEFMIHLLNIETNERRRFFLTGQPGIGKHSSFSALCEYTGLDRDDKVLGDAVASSVVLIDVDVGNGPWAADWYPGAWLKPCLALIWTSPPHQRRLRKFKSHFAADVWGDQCYYVHLVFGIFLLGRDPQEVQTRLKWSGPVAQSLFVDSQKLSHSTVDAVIKKSLAKGIFEFATFYQAGDEVYLVGPKESWTKDGVCRLNRAEPDYLFLSSAIAHRTVKLMVKSGDLFQQQIVSAFDHSPTRGAAGQLVESILHHALFRGSVDPFGVGGPGLPKLDLIGEAGNFVFEAHIGLPQPPLYLLPQSRTFAAVDAMILLPQKHAGYSRPAQLKKLNFDVNRANLVYCAIGTDGKRARSVARSVARKLQAINGVGPNARVQGYFFVDDLTGLTRVWPEGSDSVDADLEGDSEDADSEEEL